MLIGHMQTTFNNLLEIKAEIVNETKDGEDYVGTIWEEIQMANNSAKKGVSLTIQAKEGLKQLKVRAISDTTNIREELIAIRKRAEKA